MEYLASVGSLVLVIIACLSPSTRHIQANLSEQTTLKGSLISRGQIGSGQQEVWAHDHISLYSGQ
jgi:hypothetical protein